MPAGWCLWLLAGIAATAARQRFARQPEDQTTIVGQKVTLPCRVVEMSGMVQWTKDGFGLGAHRNLTGFDRYKMIGSDEEGDFSLEIYPVMLDDDARYQCQVGPGAFGQPGIRSRFAHLKVLVPPEAPRILQGDRIETTEDQMIALECVSKAGKPPAEITWLDGSGNVLVIGIQYIVETLPDQLRFNARSILHKYARREDHNTTIICQAQNAADRTPRVAPFVLEVRFAPRINIVVLNGGSWHREEGDDLKLKCVAEGNPQAISYHWFINERPLTYISGSELHLTNISRHLHKAIVKCQTSNSIGTTEQSETLHISYGPQFRTRPRSIVADVGTRVGLYCDVDGNPQPEFVWTRIDTGEVAASSANFSLHVDLTTAGRYECRASVTGFPEINAEATILIKGPPSVISKRIQYGLHGERVHVECLAKAIPKPQHISWTHEGRAIAATDDDYTIQEDSLPGGLRSTLVINRVQERHFGTYNCTVMNAYGMAVSEIALQPRSTFPTIPVVIGVLTSCALVILFAFVCLYRSKLSKEKHSKGAQVIRIPLVRDGEAPLDLVAVNGLQVDPRAHRKFLDTSNKPNVVDGCDGILLRDNPLSPPPYCPPRFGHEEILDGSWTLSAGSVIRSTPKAHSQATHV